MAVLAKAKGQVYANEAERIKLEDYYRKAWIAKNLEDVEKKPELKIKSHFKSQKQMKKNSEPVVKKKPLPKQAKIINNMFWFSFKFFTQFWILGCNPNWACI